MGEDKIEALLQRVVDIEQEAFERSQKHREAIEDYWRKQDERSARVAEINEATALRNAAQRAPTLRDHFAAKAIEGCLLAILERQHEQSASGMAATAYKIADAMLAAREKSP